MTTSIIIVILVVIAIAIVAYIATAYNDLITKRNKVKSSWAHIDAQLQRRFDLIPNLVETVRGFTAHEEKLLNIVNASKKEFTTAITNEEKIMANAELSTCLRSLYTIAGRYPELNSSKHFLKLQSELAEIEEDITYARQFYNDAVTIYNNKLMTFPSNMIASKFNFQEEKFFDASKEAELPPRFRFRERQQCPVCGATVAENDMNCEYCGCDLT